MLPFALLTYLFARLAQRIDALAMGGFHVAGSLGFLLGPLVGAGVLLVAGALGRSGWTVAFLIVAAIQWVCVIVFVPALVRRRRATTPDRRPVAQHE